MVIKNYLFGQIIHDIKHLVDGRYTGYHTPHLDPSRSEADSVDNDEVTIFLTKEVQRVIDIQKTDFVKLRNFYEGFKVRLLEQFVEQKVSNGHVSQ